MLIRMIAAVALVSTAMTPAVARSGHFAQFPQAASPRHGALAGAYVRVPLDRRGGRPVPPQVGFRLAASQDFRDPISGQGSVSDRDVVDFRLSGMGRPSLLLVGTPVTGPQARKINAIGTGEAIAIGGGVLLLLVLVTLASSPSPGECPVINGDRSHCID